MSKSAPQTAEWRFDPMSAFVEPSLLSLRKYRVCSSRRAGPRARADGASLHNHGGHMFEPYPKCGHPRWNGRISGTATGSTVTCDQLLERAPRLALELRLIDTDEVPGA